MKRLVILAALGLAGCVSLKVHREAVKMAEMRGKLEGQDQVLPLVKENTAVYNAGFVEGARRMCLYQKSLDKAKDDEGMDALADESAKQADKEAGPPRALNIDRLPDAGILRLPSRGTKGKP